MKNHKLSPFICGPRKHSVKTYHKLYNGNVTSLNTHTEDGEIVFKHNNLRINILKQKQLNVMNVFREGVPLLQVGACFATKLSMRRRRESKIKKYSIFKSSAHTRREYNGNSVSSHSICILHSHTHITFEYLPMPIKWFIKYSKMIFKCWIHITMPVVIYIYIVYYLKTRVPIERERE